MQRFNATSFRRYDLNIIREELEQYGLDSECRGEAYNPITGTTVGLLTYGILFYQVLRHFVKYKAQARGTGPIDKILRAPLGGLKMSGGLRVGNMEGDAFIAGGAASLYKERMLLSSDY